MYIYTYSTFKGFLKLLLIFIGHLHFIIVQFIKESFKKLRFSFFFNICYKVFFFWVYDVPGKHTPKKLFHHAGKSYQIFRGMTTHCFISAQLTLRGSLSGPVLCPRQVECTSYDMVTPSSVNQSLGLKVSKWPPAVFGPFPARNSWIYVQSIKSIGVCPRTFCCP